VKSKILRRRRIRLWRTNPKSQNKGLHRIDRLLLTEIQNRFPVCARPYVELGRRIGLDEARVIRLLGAYRERGIVRRIGPRYDARAFGLDTVLIALSVTPGKLRESAARINALKGVTHNYLRRHPLNIWFTLASTGRAARGKALRALARAIRPGRLIELPATRLFKLGVIFDLGIGGEKWEERPGAGETASRNERAGKIPPGIVSLIQADLTLARRPFPPGAVAAVRGLLMSGRMRRFGAVLDGKALGYRYNALVAWRVPRGRVDEAGRALAAFGTVSHCYARAAKRAWPYLLYTMVHARDRRSGIRLIGEMSRAARDDGHAVLETVRALKRSLLDPGAVLSSPK
jgi:DNA-binding Lrp family transcriptional regulator